MNIREIRELAKLVRECELSALEVNEGETRIRLERTVPAAGVQEIVVPVAAPATVPVPAPAAVPAAEPAEPVAEAITPVPGGVGAVTTAVLAKHVVLAAERAAGIG